MPPDDDEIIKIFKLVNESDFDELRLEMGSLKLHFSKNAVRQFDQFIEPAGLMDSRPTPSGQTLSDRATDAAKSEPADTDKMTSQKTDAKAAPMTEDEGLAPIKSPLLGIFYRSPKPGAPPFIEVGSRVSEDDTVCLVEVMKLYNTVKAGLKGRIVKICAENNQMVEYNQTLFLVEPVGRAGETGTL
jgi:acetyl-CoA carboxylase biotin carboxyl carrier protein